MAKDDKLRVKMVVSLAGSDHDLIAGHEYYLDAQLAHALCAEPIDGPRALPIDFEVSEAALTVAKKRHAADAAEAKFQQKVQAYRAGTLGKDETKRVVKELRKRAGIEDEN